MKNRAVKILGSIIRRDPIFITLAYIGFIWLLLIIIVCFGTPGMHKNYPWISLISSIVITAVPIIITFYHVISYKKTLSSFIHLFSLLIQIVLLFGTIYFVLQTRSVARQFKGTNQPTAVAHHRFPLSNVSSLWYQRMVNQEPDKLKTLYYALLSYQDCIHFSLITSSTVGYGNIVPRGPLAKLLVDIQIALSFIIVAFGVGIFLSMKKKNPPNLDDLTEEIEKNIHIADKTKLQEWEKYSDFMLYKFHNLKKLVEDEQKKRKR